MTKQSWNHGGKSRHARGLGGQHQRNRAYLLAHEPLCRLCQQKNPPRVTAATIADHIIPRAKGGTGDLSNLQPVCAECHDRKTRADLGWKPPKRRISVDGWPEDD